MSGVTLPTGRALVGRHVRLDVLREADLDELGLLLTDPEVYGSGYVMFPPPTSVAAGRALAAERFLAVHPPVDGRGGGRTAYAVRLVATTGLGDAGTLVGTSSLGEADLHHEKVHLGWTLYGRRWWGTRVNPETKLLLLAHCFEDCGFGRVKIQTDLLNTRSQAAISRLGAHREGVVRRDVKRGDGSFRDSVVSSILRDEWPAVRAGLEARTR